LDALRDHTTRPADMLHDTCQSIIQQTINVCQSTAPSIDIQQLNSGLI